VAQSNKRSIYVTDRLRDTLGPVGEDSGSVVTLSGRITTIADRYAEIVKSARILTQFTDAEWMLLRDALNGTLHEPAATIRELWQGVEDAITLDGLADKWSVDGADLIARLRALRFDEECALVETVEQWWIANGAARITTDAVE